MSIHFFSKINTHHFGSVDSHACPKNSNSDKQALKSDLISFEAAQTLKSSALSKFAFGLNDKNILHTTILDQLHKDLPEFGLVEENFYRGKCPNNKSLQLLSQLGINTMIDFRIPEEVENFNYDGKYNFEHIHIPTPSTVQLVEQIYSKDYQPLKDNFMNFLVATQLSKKPIYMHCEAGQLRTSLYETMYKIYFLDIDKEKAISESDKYCTSLPNEAKFNPIRAIINAFQEDNPNFAKEINAKLKEFMINKQSDKNLSNDQ